VTLVDLPGTYSLSAHSLEEIIARDFILEERPDAAIVVADATNLERNLYLAVQVLELGVPVALALNMIDRAEAEGIDDRRGSAEPAAGRAGGSYGGHPPPGPAGVWSGWPSARLHPTPRSSTTATRWSRRSLPCSPRWRCSARMRPATPRSSCWRGISWPCQALGDTPGGARCASKRKRLRPRAGRLRRRRGAAGGRPALRLRAWLWPTRWSSVAAANERNLTDRIDDVVAHRVLGLPIFFLLMGWSSS
jgi:hypothetical protein